MKKLVLLSAFLIVGCRSGINDPTLKPQGYMHIMLDGKAYDADQDPHYYGAIGHGQYVNFDAHFSSRPFPFSLGIGCPGEDSLMTYYKGETRYRDIWCAIGLENVWPGLEYGANSGTVTMTAIAKDSISGYFGFHLIGNDSSEHTLTGSFTCVAP